MSDTPPSGSAFGALPLDWWPFQPQALERLVPAARPPEAGPRPHLYHDHARPELARLMRAMGLEIAYVRAEGDWLEYETPGGYRRRVLDLMGGYGANLFGHHHPALIATLRQVLDEKLPVQAQVSCRAWAGEAAAALAERIGRTTGRDYVVTLVNTGAEAVEAALKHAELARYEDACEEARRFRRRAAQWVQQGARATSGFMRELGRELGVRPDASLAEALEAVIEANERVYAQPPVFLALERAFHGKTTGATQLTYNPAFRVPFSRVGPRQEFLPAGDASGWERAIARATTRIWEVASTDEGLVLRDRPWVNVSAILVEPIQGEGGIHELAREDAARLRALADAHGIPLVVDEIQCGLGRTGEFLASTACDLRGDYYVFAKALGGGLTKVGALAVERGLYRPNFGVVHTSTFAEDDLSSRVAARSLALLDELDVAGRCRRAGEHLLGLLHQQIERHPDVLAGVRGRGLMLGLEFHAQGQNPSNVVRMLNDQGFLGYAIAGYMLHEEGFRVGPTLAASRTLRLEPSAFIEPSQLERFAGALDRLCTVIERGNAYRLTRYLVGRADPADHSPAEDFRPAARKLRREAPTCEKRVAFIGHLIHARDAVLWDPSLARLPAGSVEHFQLSTHRVLGPTIYDQAHVTSAIGEKVHLSFIGINLTSKSIEAAMRARDTGWIVDLIEEAVGVAHRAGCQVVGLGGYTSIVTDNGRRLAPPPGVAITTGNSLTVGMGLEALRRGARQQGLDLAGCTAGIVGAAGNIGMVHARLLAREVPRLVLVGRTAGSRLANVANAVYLDALEAIRLQRPPSGLAAGGALLGVAGAIAHTQAVQRALALPPEERAGERLAAWLVEELGEQVPIIISSDMGALARCELIVTCSNSATPIVQAEHLAPGPVVICDLSVPADVDPTVATRRPDVLVVRGGLVAIPGDPDFRIGGIPLPAGHAYACMSETLLLGLMGVREHFSLGPVAPAKVQQALAWAEVNGFRLGLDKVERSF